jgi:hypothetical protein
VAAIGLASLGLAWRIVRDADSDVLRTATGVESD